MAAKFNYNDIADNSLFDGFEKIIQYLEQIDKTAQKVKANIKLSGNGSTGTGKEYIDNEKQIETLERLIELEKQRAKLKSDLKNEQKALKESEKIQKEIDKQTKAEKELTDAINKQYKSISDLQKINSHLEKQRKEMIVSNKQEQSTYDNLTKEINKNAAAINKHNESIGRHQHKVGQYENALKSVGTSIGNLAGAFGVAGGISLFADQLVKATSIVVNFDDKINELGAILNISDNDLISTKDYIKTLGETTKFTATQVAEAAIELAKLGFTTNDIQQSLSGILDGSVAMGASVPEMAELASKSVKAFGLDVSQTEQVVATFAASSNTTATGFRYLADSLPYAATAAKTYGMSIEQTTALLGILADNGVKAESSGVALRDMFTDLASKGMSFEEAMSKINGSTNKAKTAFDLFGKTSVNQAVIIAENINKFDGLTKAVTNQEKALKDLVTKRLDTIKGQFQILQSTWEGFILSIEDGDGKFSDSIKNLLRFTSDLINNLTPIKAVFNEMFSEAERLGSNLLLLADQIGFLNKETSLAETIMTSLSNIMKAGMFGTRALLFVINNLVESVTFLRNKFLDFAENLGIVDKYVINLIKNGNFFKVALETWGQLIKQTTSEIQIFGTSMFELIQKFTFYNEIFGSETRKLTTEFKNIGKTTLDLLKKYTLYNEALEANEQKTEKNKKSAEELNAIYKERYNLLKQLGLLSDKAILENEVKDLRDAQRKGLLTTEEFLIARDDLYSDYNKKIYEKQQISLVDSKQLEDNFSKVKETTKTGFDELTKMAGEFQKQVQPETKDESFISKLFGDENTLNLIETQLTNATNIYIEALQKQKNARLDALNQEIEVNNESINQLNDKLKTELQANEQGLANNYTQTQIEIENEKKKQAELKKQRDEAIKAKVRADRLQILSDTATQISSLITASAQIWASVAKTGVASPFLASGLIGAMWASFLKSKATAYKTAGDVPKFKDGVIDLQGRGTETSDSIDAKLSKGESVMTAKETKTSKNILLGIRKGLINDNNLLNSGDSQIVELLKENNEQNKMIIGNKKVLNRTTIKYI